MDLGAAARRAGSLLAGGDTVERTAALALTATAGTGPAAATTAVADPRVQLVGYGPSASTIGANRAGRVAARGVAAWLDRDVQTESMASSA